MKQLKYSFIGLASILMMTGCSDFLDPRNLSNPDNSDEYFSEHPEQIRPVAYDAIRFIAEHIDMLDQASDLYINPRGANDGVFSMFIQTPDDGTVESYYKNIYSGINKANCMIHYAGDNAELIAEGKFLRALGYYYLTQQFGAVPYVDFYIQNARRDFPRTPLNEIYENVLADCEDIYNNSPLPARDHTGKASKQSVAALAAKVALAAAWDLDTELIDAEAGTYSVKDTKRFKEAAAWAEKAIDGIELTMPFAEKWAWNNEGNVEEIFSAQYDRNGYPGNTETGGHSLMYNYTAFTTKVTDTGIKGNGSGGTNLMSAKSASLFEHGDQRFDGTFMTKIYNAPRKVSLTTGLPAEAEWDKGYMAWYNMSVEEQESLPVGVRFYSPGTTIEEAEADIREMIRLGQAKKFANNTYGVNIPFAAIISGTDVIKWEFNTNGTMPTSQKISFMDFCGAGDNNGVTVTKYDDPASGPVTAKQCYRDIPLFHVSEMYLTAAEAYLLAGDEGASLTKINAVRKRAGLGNLTSYSAYEAPYVTNVKFVFTPLDLVLDERARECYAERTRYFDLRRTKQLVRYNLEFSRFIKSVNNMSNAQGEIKWYRPIPQAEIDSNTAMTNADQNPG
ncbi:MAG: RagB/SusD family nutrient uptake outer membrane protein, partial [Muribaculaceae bacterium]|nr:RagB/SusD family nutrient uptake outer membrane protein [Muribaculaceae bacterium]